MANACQIKALDSIAPSLHVPRAIPCLTSLTKPIYLTRSTSNSETAVDLKDIKAIIDLMKENDLSVFEMEKDGFRLKLQKGAGDNPCSSLRRRLPSAPSCSPDWSAAAAQQAAAGQTATGDAHSRKSFRQWSAHFIAPVRPTRPSFVDVGATVTEDTVVCIIEAMKVMNEIKAETSGVIAEIVAENGKPVQFGQALFRVR